MECVREGGPRRLNSTGGREDGGGGVARWQRVARGNRDSQVVPATGVSIIQHITASAETNIMHILSKDSKSGDSGSKQSREAAGRN